MMGKPVIAGTRITVENILEKLSFGETIDQILKAYPRLTKEAIFQALAFTADALRADIIYPIKESAQMVLLADENIDKSANKSNAILMTFDKDFGEMVFRRKLVNKGVILNDIPIQNDPKHGRLLL